MMVKIAVDVCKLTESGVWTGPFACSFEVLRLIEAGFQLRTCRLLTAMVMEKIFDATDGVRGSY